MAAAGKRRIRVPRPAKVDILALAREFVEWQRRTGHHRVCTLAGVVAVERAQAAQGVVLASDAAKARIAGTGT